MRPAVTHPFLLRLGALDLGIPPTNLCSFVPTDTSERFCDAIDSQSVANSGCPNEDESSRLVRMPNGIFHCDDGAEGLPVNDGMLEIQAVANRSNIVGQLSHRPTIDWTVFAAPVAAKVQIHDLDDLG